MKNEKNKNIITTIIIDYETYEKIRKKAYLERKSISSIIRDSLNKYIR